MNTELKLYILTNLHMELSLVIAVSRFYSFILLEINMANLTTELEMNMMIKLGSTEQPNI